MIITFALLIGFALVFVVAVYLFIESIAVGVRRSQATPTQDSDPWDGEE